MYLCNVKFYGCKFYGNKRMGYEEVFSDVQELWDRYKKETHVCLIVSGSIFRMMEKRRWT